VNDCPHGSLQSLWGRDAAPGLDLRMCKACGDWFFWDGAPTHVARTIALVAEELLTGTSRGRERLAVLATSLTPPQLAALVDHLSDEALAKVREALVEWRTSAPREVALAITGRLMTPATRAAAPLAPDELAGFWALGIPLEASWVGAEELARAVAESRVQEVSSYSSMGTAETGWTRRCSNPAEGAVVPPGHTAEETDYDDLADDRDVTYVCWQPFWSRQVYAALEHVTGSARRYVLQECTRRLVELERLEARGDASERQRLLEWLVEPAADLEGGLADLKSRPLEHVVRGVRARWLTFDCYAAFQAVLDSAAGPCKRLSYEHGNTRRESEVRMELLRFVVELTRP
jgi:hypothetical protein